MLFLYLLCLGGTIVFTYFLPEIWWEVSWGDIIKIISNNDKNVNFATDFSKLLQTLGISDTNLHTWAVERLLICLAIGIGLIIVFTILYKLLKKKKR